MISILAKTIILPDYSTKKRRIADGKPPLDLDKKGVYSFYTYEQTLDWRGEVSVIKNNA
jgi:hypothetical protein